MSHIICATDVIQFYPLIFYLNTRGKFDNKVLKVLTREESVVKATGDLSSDTVG